MTNATARHDQLRAWGYRPEAETGCWVPVDRAHEFGYSDGDAVEARLLAWVRAVADRRVLSEELRAGITDWPSRYHLSPLRANLLRPLAGWLSGRTVLEIGAGCGALTRYLGELDLPVVALEGSPRRAAIAAARCADLAKVAVIADDFQHFAPRVRFDVITLVGVLEYARLFYRADAGVDPVNAMLARARELLNPGGVLLLAIENQLGLKYFAGSREDHVAAPMYGIEDLYRSDGVVTFGRAELGDRLDAAGLPARAWWYPFPDYKLPVSVLSEAAVSGRHGLDLSPLPMGSVVADPQVPPHWNFSLEQAWRVIFRNRLAGELANSFLVAAGTRELDLPPADALVHHYAVDRRPAFAKAVTIGAVGDCAAVTSARLAAEAPLPALPLRQHLCDARFAPGELWHGRLLQLLNQPGWTVAAIADWMRTWLGHLAQRAGVARLEWSMRLDGGLVDAVPHNLMVTGEGGEFIDLEWELTEGVGFDHLFYRGLVLSLLGAGSCAEPAPGQSIEMASLFGAVAAACGYRVGPGELAACHAAERRFQYWVHGGAWIDFGELVGYRMPVRAGVRN